MHGLILAAGLGTRLGDLGDTHNKVLLDIGGVTLIENILNHFERCGAGTTSPGHANPPVRIASPKRRDSGEW